MPIRYNFLHALVAAAIGAFANCIVWSIVITREFDLSLWLLFFVIGFISLATAGLPLARRLAREGRDSLRIGAIYGSVGGCAVGALLASVRPQRLRH